MKRVEILITFLCFSEQTMCLASGIKTSLHLIASTGFAFSLSLSIFSLYHTARGEWAYSLEAIKVKCASSFITEGRMMPVTVVFCLLH